MPDSSLPVTVAPSTHDPERRLFDRVRTWIDVFPWLRLVRVCRIAGGPVWILHTLLITGLWMLGMRYLGCELIDWKASGTADRISWLTWSTTQMPGDMLVSISGSSGWSITGQSVDASSWLISGWMAWSILVWIPTAMALVRTGALLAAGRDMPSYFTTLRAVVARLGSAIVVLLVPAIVAGFLIGIAAGVTWIANAIGGSAAWASWLTLPIVLPATLIAAVFVVAGKSAVPLALTSLMVEPDADPIDALSRGYEYTLRRLPQLVLLVLVATVIAGIIVLAWLGLCHVGAALATVGPTPSSALLRCLQVLPAVIGVMLFWSMIGGIYLLLRQSAGGQEIEDLAIESGHWQSPKLPSVTPDPRSPRSD